MKHKKYISPSTTVVYIDTECLMEGSVLSVGYDTETTYESTFRSKRNNFDYFDEYEDE